jgi:Methyltransferase TRM13
MGFHRELSVAGLLDNAANQTFVEVGAGKAYLSLMLARAVDGVSNLVLNDVGTFRNKADRLLRKDSGKPLFIRCQADLKDFFIPGALHALCTSEGSTKARFCQDEKEAIGFVAFGKHLCGAASDFALMAAVNGA